jgi:DNA-binding transcriptional ArsR family regulator
MSFESDSNRRVIKDPTAMRALAHPLRIKLHALLGREGKLTASEAARQLGISQALASHHLRQLAKYGFVEPATAGDHRERPWRAAATSRKYEPGEVPEAWRELDLMERFAIERSAENLEEWHQRRATEDPELVRRAGVSQNLVYLTVDELAAFQAAWGELITPLVDRRPMGDAQSRPHDALPIDVTLVVAPLRRTASGG